MIIPNTLHQDFEFSSIIQNWRQNSPRINELAQSFASIATGNQSKPFKTPLDEENISFCFQNDMLISTFFEICKKKFGCFGHHFISSIPYSLHEWCRLGCAITSYLLALSQETNRPVCFQSIGSAEGVVARSIAELGQGNIYTLTNSSTSENASIFNANAPKTAFFFSGPFFEISKEILRYTPNFTNFIDGFDIIFEDTCFQMHATNRKAQIQWACQHLRENGIFIAWEKCLSNDKDEYIKREYLKNTYFKSRYFTPDQIHEKEDTILQSMKKGQVSLETLINELAATFKHIAVIWNCSNFYVVVASNTPQNLEKLHSCLLPHYLPNFFQHISIPDTLYGPKLNLIFRNPMDSLS